MQNEMFQQICSIVDKKPTPRHSTGQFQNTRDKIGFLERIKNENIMFLNSKLKTRKQRSNFKIPLRNDLT